MKKLFLTLLGVASLVGATSCSNEEEMMQPVPVGEGQTFIVNMPGELRGRSFGDGLTASTLTYAVYEHGSQAVLSQGNASFSGLTATVNLKLVNGRSYDIVFWAANDAAPYSFDAATQSITVDYTDVKLGNDETRDAFFKTETNLLVEGPMEKSIVLTRPFAQLNFGTSDLADVTALGFTDLKTSLSVRAYKTMNLVDGTVGGPTDVVFDMTELPDAAEAFPVQGYDYLSMNYLLMPADKETNDVSLKVSSFANGTERELKTVALSAVPMQRNYRTNIYGALLTSSVNWIVEINPDWETPDHEMTATVSSKAELVAALKDKNITKVEIPADLDLSEATPEELTFDSPKTLSLAKGVTLQLGSANCFTVNAGLTIEGEGTITNAGTPSEAGKHKSLIHIYSGDLVIKGTEIVNDPSHHWHGVAAGFNSSAITYWNDANVTIEDARVISGEFTLCGMGRSTASGNITLKNSYFESTSSSQNGTGNWAYAMRVFGKNALLENCEVKGIQGGVSPDGCVEMTINGGKYYTVNSPGKEDAFYPLYVTSGTVVTILDGEFIAANKRTGLNIEGTSAAVSGDNDTGLPVGSIVLKGGKFSGKAYNSKTNKIYEPADGFKWQAIEDGGDLKWEVVPAN